MPEYTELLNRKMSECRRSMASGILVSAYGDYAAEEVAKASDRDASEFLREFAHSCSEEADDA